MYRQSESVKEDIMSKSQSEESKWARQFSYSARDSVRLASISDANIENEASQRQIKNTHIAESV